MVTTNVYYTAQVLNAVSVFKAYSFFVDRTKFDVVSFSKSLFKEIKRTNLTSIGLHPANFGGTSEIAGEYLFFLTDSAAEGGMVMPVIVCDVDKSFSAGNVYYNTSVCRSEGDGAKACTTNGATCKVPGVVGCSCPALWAAYPPIPQNLSAVTPAPATTTKAPSGTSAPATTTVAPKAASGGSALFGSASHRFDESFEVTNYVQLEFTFRLEFAPAFRPTSVAAILAMYSLLRNVTLDALRSPNMFVNFLIDTQSVDERSVMYVAPPIPPPPVIETTTPLLPIFAALVFPTIFVGFVGYKLFKYWRWRQTVGRFSVVDVSAEEGDGAAPVGRDEEMMAKLGTGDWISTQKGRGVGDDVKTFVTPQRGTQRGSDDVSEGEFDPLARIREAEEEEAKRAARGKAEHKDNYDDDEDDDEVAAHELSLSASPSRKGHMSREERLKSNAVVLKLLSCDDDSQKPSAASASPMGRVPSSVRPADAESKKGAVGIDSLFMDTGSSVVKTASEAVAAVQAPPLPSPAVASQRTAETPSVVAATEVVSDEGDDDENEEEEEDEDEYSDPEANLR